MTILISDFTPIDKVCLLFIYLYQYDQMLIRLFMFFMSALTSCFITAEQRLTSWDWSFNNL